MLLGDLDGPYFQRFFVDAYVYLTPTSRDHAAHNPGGQWMRRLEPPTARQHMFTCVRGMLAGVPLAFTFGLDACAVD